MSELAKLTSKADPRRTELINSAGLVLCPLCHDAICCTNVLHVFNYAMNAEYTLCAEARGTEELVGEPSRHQCRLAHFSE